MSSVNDDFAQILEANRARKKPRFNSSNQPGHEDKRDMVRAHIEDTEPFDTRTQGENFPLNDLTDDNLEGALRFYEREAIFSRSDNDRNAAHAKVRSCKNEIRRRKGEKLAAANGVFRQ